MVWVRHQDEALVPGTPAWQLVPALVPLPGEPVLGKEYADAFEATELEEVLAAAGVGRIVVTGAATGRLRPLDAARRLRARLRHGPRLGRAHDGGHRRRRRPRPGRDHRAHESLLVPAGGPGAGRGDGRGGGRGPRGRVTRCGRGRHCRDVCGQRRGRALRPAQPLGPRAERLRPLLPPARHGRGRGARRRVRYGGHADARAGAGATGGGSSGSTRTGRRWSGRGGGAMSRGSRGGRRTRRGARASVSRP